MPEMMRAVGFTEFGDPSVLRIVTVPKPSPGPGQVLVKVAAATVNPTDLGFRAGGRPLPPGVEPPYIPGMDLAGVIDAVGLDVTGPDGTRWRVGDRVMAADSASVPGGGAQAEYVAVAEDQLARVPDAWSLEEAATLPMNGLTVRTALDLLALAPGSTLAVTGSAGIVGQFAIQLGRHEGLTVIGDAAPAPSPSSARSTPTAWTRSSTRRCSAPRSSAPCATAASCWRSARTRASPSGTSPSTWCSSASTCTRGIGSPRWLTW
jgi:NADPH:quinone reductase-like Zn-dependent oxidoreductase